MKPNRIEWGGKIKRKCVRGEKVNEELGKVPELKKAIELKYDQKERDNEDSCEIELEIGGQFFLYE